MNLRCVLEGFVNPSWPRVEQYIFVLTFSFVAAVVLAPLLLYRYRRRVIQLMGGEPQTAERAPDPNPSVLLDELESAGAALIHAARSSDTIERLTTAGREHARQMARSIKKTVLVFSVATVATALALKLQAAAASGPVVFSLENAIVWTFVAVTWVLLMLGMSWPIVLLGTTNPRFARWFFFVTIPCFLLLMAMPFNGPQLTDSQLGGLAALAAFVLLMCIGLGPRHMRNVVPTLTLAVSAIVFAWREANNVASSLNACFAPLSLLTGAKRLGLTVAVLALIALVPTAGIWGAYQALSGLSSAYRHKRFSDAQLQMLLWFVLIAAPVAAIIYASVRGPTAPPLPLLASISILTTAVAYRWLAHRLPPPHRPPVTLLLLRVFGRSRQGERLLDSLASYWRFVGPVCMIAGPDLAKAYVEPPELAAFLSRKLRGGFIADTASLARSITEIDLAPDPDTRYRVNELFCAGEIWVTAARILIQRCDVVLIDLREFRAGRLGTATELRMLSSLGALERTIVIVGEKTDMSAVKDTIGTSLRAIDDQPHLRIVNDVDSLSAYELFSKVVEVILPDPVSSRPSAPSG
jgi:hypothetical protein